jgi:acetyl esterase
MPPDYDRLLDRDVRAFIAKTVETYPDKTVDITIAEQRAVYDAMCQAFYQGRPAVSLR